MSDLFALVEYLRSQYAGQLGTFQPDGRCAIAVDPGPIPSKCEGIRLIVQRYPSDIGQSEKASGATYYPDQYKVELVNFAPVSDVPADAAKMTTLLRRMETDLDIKNRRYFPPSTQSYERALFHIFAPSLVLD